MAEKVQVIMSVGRRRRFTDEEKRRIVEEAALPEATVSDVARRHGISPSLLFSWRKAQLRGTAVAPPELDASVAARIDALRTAIAKVRAEAAGKVARFPRELSREALALIEAGLSAAQVVMATGLPATTLSRWRQEACVPQLRELRLTPNGVIPPASTAAPNAVLKIGPVRVELSDAALHDETLWQLLARLGEKAS